MPLHHYVTCLDKLVCLGHRKPVFSCAPPSWWILISVRWLCLWRLAPWLRDSWDMLEFNIRVFNICQMQQLMPNLLKMRSKWDKVRSYWCSVFQNKQMSGDFQVHEFCFYEEMNSQFCLFYIVLIKHHVESSDCLRNSTQQVHDTSPFFSFHILAKKSSKKATYSMFDTWWKKQHLDGVLSTLNQTQWNSYIKSNSCTAQGSELWAPHHNQVTA